MYCIICMIRNQKSKYVSRELELVDDPVYYSEDESEKISYEFICKMGDKKYGLMVEKHNEEFNHS